MTQTVFGAVFATVLGAIIGSFLNACIHRLPRNLSLSEPKRSFCPECRRTLPWYENLPILSYLVLRGKCAGCGTRIPLRYLIVEVATAALFCLAWLKYGLPLAPVYWLLLALLIAATFIDIEHFIIPDVITWGGTVAGVVLSAVVPAMMETDSRWQALSWSVLGAAVGYGLLWAIVEFGKLAFGKKRHAFPEDVPFVWQRDGDTASITIGGDRLEWNEIFSRPKDLLVLEGVTAELDGKKLAVKEIRFRYDVLIVDGKATALEEFQTITGTLRAVVIPREAMGFGDVKFIAAIGAFLGWKAVFFTLGSASIIGTFAALAGIFLARDKAGTRVPFGPFLALGAALWIFGGQLIWNWYLGLMGHGGLEF